MWLGIAIASYAAYGIVMTLAIGFWAVESVGVERAIRALGPHLDRGLVRIAAGLIGACLSFLVLIGAGALKELVSEHRREQRAKRWRSKNQKLLLWTARIEKFDARPPAEEIEEIYWDGIDLRDSFITGSDSRKRRDDLSILQSQKQKAESLIQMFGSDKVTQLNQTLGALKRLHDKNV